MAQTVKNLAAMQETCVPSLGREDPLEEEMAADSSILAWRIPRIEEPGGLQSMGQHIDTMDRLTHTHTHTHTSSVRVSLLHALGLSRLGLREDKGKRIVDRIHKPV